MSRPGWSYSRAHETASFISSVVLLKLIAVLLLCCSTCQAVASPAAVHIVDSPLSVKKRHANIDLNRPIQNNLHSHNNGAGRIVSESSEYRENRVISNPSASLIPSQPENNEVADIYDFSLDASFDGSFIRPRSINDWAVADFILISSIDGSLHALDRHTGLEIWSIPGEQPLVHVSTSESLKNASKSRNYSSSCEDCDLIWITEPLGEGTLYYFTPDKGLQQLPISIKELVQSPFAFGKDQKLITGSHHTTLYSIESKTGRILKVYGAEKSSLSQASCPTPSNLFFLDDEEYDDEDDEFVNDGSFMVGRTGK